MSYVTVIWVHVTAEKKPQGPPQTQRPGPEATESLQQHAMRANFKVEGLL